jgi:hypothetical protein
VGVLGLSLQFTFITLIILLVVIFCLYYPHVVQCEEKILYEKFGEHYAQYQREVPRWFPRTLKMTMPKKLMIEPRVILKSICDASLFFVAYPLLEWLKVMHFSGVIHTYWIM